MSITSVNLSIWRFWSCNFMFHDQTNAFLRVASFFSVTFSSLSLHCFSLRLYFWCTYSQALLWYDNTFMTLIIKQMFDYTYDVVVNLKLGFPWTTFFNNQVTLAVIDKICHKERHEGILHNYRFSDENLRGNRRFIDAEKRQLFVKNIEALLLTLLRIANMYEQSIQFFKSYLLKVITATSF